MRAVVPGKLKGSAGWAGWKSTVSTPAAPTASKIIKTNPKISLAGKNLAFILIMIE